MNITVIVHPNSKKPRLERDLFGGLHAYVAAPPLEGKANRAVAEALAKHFGVAKSAVTFVRGVKSKIKVFKIP